MIKLSLVIALILFSQGVHPPEVKVAGALRHIMIEGDLSSHIKLDTLTKQNLYGLGPVAGLKGEIIILNGKIYSSTKSSDQLIHRNEGIDAAMLVYSHVKKWKAITFNKKIQNNLELENLIKMAAAAHGIDSKTPFAFKIESSLAIADYHVIDWNKRTKHTMENHRQFAYEGTLKNEKISFLGFYSAHHKGIFTHHTSNMHVHVLGQGSGITGHLDNVKVPGKFTLFLPLSQ
jgi:acetolactate decarboxylase